MTTRRLVKYAAAGLATSVMLAMSAQATTVEIEAEVRRTLAVADDRWGGCMVALSVSPSEEGLDCPTSKWVTFSCTGEHTSKSRALRMYDSAQLAFVAGWKVRVWVDDTKKHNGFCFVSRIDVLAGE